MNVKIDTKERFTVITPQESRLPVNMTEELRNLLLPYLQKDIPHIILNMSNVTAVDELMGEELSLIHEQFYEKNCSFVICSLHPDIIDVLNKKELLDILNVTPSESEAWDIVQMEEIERELMSGEE